MTGTDARNVDRLVFFSDAVVAIAITLLALPLSEIPRDERTGHPLNTLPVQLQLDLAPLFGAALSFFVIARLWWAHHQLFARVERFSIPLVIWNMVWLFSIVVLSAVTALVPEYSPTERPLVVLVYIAVMTVSALLLTGIAVVVYRGVDLTTEPKPEVRERVIGIAFTAGTFAVAGVLGYLVPVVNYFALWLLVPSGFVEGWVKRRIRARDRA